MLVNVGNVGQVGRQGSDPLAWIPSTLRAVVPASVVSFTSGRYAETTVAVGDIPSATVEDLQVIRPGNISNFYSAATWDSGSPVYSTINGVQQLLLGAGDTLTLNALDTALMTRPAVGTVVLAGTYNLTAGNQTLFEVSDGTTDEFIRVLFRVDQTARLHVQAGGLGQSFATTSNALSDGEDFVVVASWEVNDFRIVLNNGSVFNDLTGNLPTGLDQAVIGELVGGGNRLVDTGLKYFAYIPSVISDAEMQAIAASS
jgi:hypothetical protein